VNNQQVAVLSRLFIVPQNTLHVSGVLCTHHQEYIKLQSQPLV